MKLKQHFFLYLLIYFVTVESRYNEGPRDWQIFFAITRFRSIEVLFHIFYYYWSRIEVRYVI